MFGYRSFKLAATRLVVGIQSVWTRIGGMGVGSRMRTLLPGSRLDYEKEAGDLWQNSLVAIVLKWVGDNYPKPKMRVCQLKADGTTKPLARHPVVDLVRKPNPFYTGRVLAKIIALSILTDGNAYVVKIRNGIKRPVQLWWVPHWMMQPVWDQGEGAAFIRAYQFIRDYEIIEIPAADVIHFRDGLDPRNDRLGLAAVKAQVREICTDNEASGYTASILRNAGVPGLVAMPKGATRIDKGQGDRLRDKVRDALTGDMRGDTMVMLTGEMEIKTLGFSPEEMRLDKLPAKAEARVCASLGVSPMVVGLSDPNKTYSNLAEANSAGWRHCIVPLQDLVAETLRYQLLNEFGDPETLTIEFDYSEVEALQEDLKALHDRVREDWKANLISQNEARDQIGFEPDPDGDKFLFQLTMVSAEDGTDDEDGTDSSTTSDPANPNPALPADGVVADTALNGAQITSLLAIAEAVAAETLPADTAAGLIEASFPGIDPDQIARILGPLAGFKPAAPAPAPTKPGQPTPTPPDAKEPTDDVESDPDDEDDGSNDDGPDHHPNIDDDDD